MYLLKIFLYTTGFISVVYIEELIHWDEAKETNKYKKETLKIRFRCFLATCLVILA